jgi:hypothetical protein
MMSFHQWNQQVFAQDVDSSEQISSSSSSSLLSSPPLTVDMSFIQPEESDLWLASPWYENNRNNNVSLSFTPPSSNGARYAITCSKDQIQKVSDDGWLFSQWLQQMEKDEQKIEGVKVTTTTTIGGEGEDTNSNNAASVKHGGCREINSLKQTFNISAPLSKYNVSRAIELIEASLTHHHSIRGEHQGSTAVLFRLHKWDGGLQESMSDVILFDGIKSNRSTKMKEKKKNMNKLDDDKLVGDRKIDENNDKHKYEEDGSKSSGGGIGATVGGGGGGGVDSRLNLLRGLNSNSHSFPWAGRNKYPRLFESGALVLKDACVRRDGAIVQYGQNLNNLFNNNNNRRSGDSFVDARQFDLDKDGIAEYHYGGCGCCPYGHGELGKTFTCSESSFILKPEDKVIVLVQRFHHGI